jgi:hypothetical protein
MSGIVSAPARARPAVDRAGALVELPVEPSTGDMPGYVRELTAIGVQMGNLVPGRPLFRWALLPAGWWMVAADRDRNQRYVLDEYGRRRVLVFHKQSFWDERAHGVVMTVAGYVRTLVDGTDAQLVLDDTWATPAAVADAAARAARAEQATGHAAGRHAQARERHLRRAVAFEAIVRAVGPIGGAA